MTFRLLSVGMMLSMIAARGPAGTVPPQPPQQPPRTVFRSTAAAVAVDVSVRDRTRRSITGLAAADFEIYDSGVRQRVDAVSYGKLPIDVTVALDVSYSVTGSLLDRLRQGVVELMRDLGSDDRLELVLFNMQVDRVVGFTRDVKAVERAMGSARAGGGTALFDAISTTLVSPTGPDRRHLIVFFTDGTDSSSTTPADTLTAIAQRTRATLAFVVPRTVAMPISFGGPPGVTVVPPPPRTINVLPPQHAIFSRLAAETGGSFLPITSATSLSSTFRSVLGEFRSAYVLYYTPQGVPSGGYHAIEVKTGRDGAVVQARRGYFGS
jgi:VWFA-related protein